jgi:hypothetical protein
LKSKLHITGATILFFFLFPVLKVHSTGIKKGFEALRIYDYFKARKFFHREQKKKINPFSSYGLAVIHSRHDNPFYNLDSASKYIRLSYHTYACGTQPLQVAGFYIDSLSILSLADSVARMKFAAIKNDRSIETWDTFLWTNYLCSAKITKEAVNIRDELEFTEVIHGNQSIITSNYLVTHPTSSYYKEAVVLKDRQIYYETVTPDDDESLMTFIDRNHGNAMVATAFEKLFTIYSGSKDLKGMAGFVRRYPDAPQFLEAWKLLFSWSVKSYSFHELKGFLSTYPDFPLKNSILKELELNKLILHPYEKDDFFGFIDNRGKIVIGPVYDAATAYSDGLSLVSKNDSVFFINKENVNPFNMKFSDAFNFKNGVAPVKTGQKWSFINRLGQTVSGQYDEINELSNRMYVVRSGSKYGALDLFAQVIIEPRYEKLGDFKNGYAYFIENGHYGFISKAGEVKRSEFEWISDFSDDQVALVKKNNKFGLINSDGVEILAPVFDQVIKTEWPVFIVVKDNNYGFFSAYECFLTPVDYDYLKEKPPGYYTNGTRFKLLRKNEQAIVDGNGMVKINFGVYEEEGFPSNGLTAVRKKNKWGFVDEKLNAVIACKYSHASDFIDSIAIVGVNDISSMLDRGGREILTTIGEIERISRTFFLLHEVSKKLVNRRGETVLTEVENIQRGQGMLIVTLRNGEIKLLSG